MIYADRYNGSSWVDISMYLISNGTGKIPFIDRNSDWSPIASGFNISITSKYNVTISRGDKFRFRNDSQVIFAGYADQVKYDYGGLYWNIYLINDLMKLETTKLEYAALHSIVSASPDSFEYNDNDTVGSETFANINMLYLMKCCFASVGMSLDTSNVDSVVFDNTWLINVPYNRLVLDYESIYSLGNNVAVAHAKIDSDHYDSKITMFNLLEWLCKIFRFTLVLTDVNSYSLYAVNNIYSITDNKKYQYEDYKLLKQYEDAYISMYAPNTAGVSGIQSFLRYYFYQTSENNLREYYAPGYIGAANLYIYPHEGETRLDWLNNLMIMPYEISSGAFTDKMYNPQWDTAAPLTSFPIIYSFMVRKNLIDAVIKDIQSEKITTDYTTTVKSVVKNYIDIENKTSEIEQETYL